MALDDVQLDGIVYDVIRDCSKSNVDLTREEICKLVLDHLQLHAMDYVMKSIPRLEVAKKIVVDRDVSRGRPYIHYISRAK